MNSAPASPKNSNLADAAGRRESRLQSLLRHPTLHVALCGALLMWAALPPLGLSVLGWIAPVPWLWLARQPELRGRRPYLAIWFAAFVFWLGALHWLRLPHWATSFGWVALAVYQAFYTPLLVAIARFARRRFGIGIVVSAPILWTACDQARAYMLSGFSMGSLSHTQYRWTSVIQAADLCGEFGVTFLMVLVAAAIARALPLGSGDQNSRRWNPPWLGLAVGVVALMFGYGQWRLADSATRFSPGPKIALIQGSIDTEMKYDPNEAQRVYDHYYDLSRRAVAADPNVQLVVWPETMFPAAMVKIDDDAGLGTTEGHVLEFAEKNSEASKKLITDTATSLRRPLMLGIGAMQFTREGVRHWNSVLYTDKSGEELGRYDKRHPVPFGEYTPFAKQLPFLYALTPLTGGIEEGEHAEAFDLNGVNLVPSICYETVLARLIRDQVVELRERGIEPDVLVNVTNDGWFWGSSELDLHLMCGVFRAVESRKPLVIAANTGFSAHIDSDGRIVQQGPRREAGFINAQVSLDRRRSPYMAAGDWLANGCVGLTVLLSGAALLGRRRKAEPTATIF